MEPKPPPMNDDTTWMFFFGTAKVSARSRQAQSIIWFDVQTVSLSPCHAAIVANGSIAEWLWSGVV